MEDQKKTSCIQEEQEMDFEKTLLGAAFPLVKTKTPSVIINFEPRSYDVCLAIPEFMKAKKDNSNIHLSDKQMQEIVTSKMKDGFGNDSIFLEIIKAGSAVDEYEIGDFVNVEDLVGNARRLTVDGITFIIVNAAVITGKKIYVE